MSRATAVCELEHDEIGECGRPAAAVVEVWAWLGSQSFYACDLHGAALYAALRAEPAFDVVGDLRPLSRAERRLRGPRGRLAA